MSLAPDQASIDEINHPSVVQQLEHLKKLERNKPVDVEPLKSLATLNDFKWLAPIDLYHANHNRKQTFKTSRLAFSIIHVMHSGV